MKTFTIHVVEVKALPLYECACGAKAQGQTVRLTLNGLYTAQTVGPRINEELSTMGNNSLPHGWSGAGVRFHSCPTCTATRR